MSLGGFGGPSSSPTSNNPEAKAVRRFITIAGLLSVFFALLLVFRTLDIVLTIPGVSSITDDSGAVAITLTFVIALIAGVTQYLIDRNR